MKIGFQDHQQKLGAEVQALEDVGPHGPFDQLFGGNSILPSRSGSLLDGWIPWFELRILRLYQDLEP